MFVWQAKIKLLWSVCLCFLFFTSFTYAGDDEPGDAGGLRCAFWPHVSECKDCFIDFTSYVMGQGYVPPVQQVPGSFPWLWVEAESFPQRILSGATFWQQVGFSGASGNEILRGHVWNDLTSTRRVVHIPSEGYYRVWVRYYYEHTKPCSFRLKILHARAADMSYDRWYDWWLVEPEVYLERKFAEDDYDPGTGWRWESAYCWLPAGDVALELNGARHLGTYGYRNVDVIVLTTDPLADADIGDRPPGTWDDTLVYHSASEDTSLLWEWWQVHPGSATIESPIPSDLYNLWQQWRNGRIDYLGGLDANAITDIHTLRLMRWAVFDPRWNLIGIASRVSDRITYLQNQVSQVPVNGFFKWFEAEDFLTMTKIGSIYTDDRWYKMNIADWPLSDRLWEWNYSYPEICSDGQYLTAQIWTGLAGAVKPIDLPAGTYRIYVRYFDVIGSRSDFTVSLHSQSDTDFTSPIWSKTFDQTDKTPNPWRMWVWDYGQASVPTAGSYNILIKKNIAPPSVSRRFVDCIAISDSSSWYPDQIEKQIPSLSTADALRNASLQKFPSLDGLLLWSKNSCRWTGWSSQDWPESSDELIGSEGITVEPVRTGLISSHLLFVTNPNDQPITIDLSVGSENQGWLSAYLVASLLTHECNWQPHVLLKRQQITVPPRLTTGIWLKVDSRDLDPGDYSGSINLGPATVPISFRAYPNPTIPREGYFGSGWSPGYPGLEFFKDLGDHGINLVHEALMPKEAMEQCGLRMCLATPFEDDPHHVPTQSEVGNIVGITATLGLDYNDWTWRIFDEPWRENYQNWVACAQGIRTADANIQIWCNPGGYEYTGPTFPNGIPEDIAAMAPYSDIFCPYMNHFYSGSDNYSEYAKNIGNVKLFYETPFGFDLAPASALDMINLLRPANRYSRDGIDWWIMVNYSGGIYDSHHDGPWNDIDGSTNYPGQTVRLYPGFGMKPIWTRSYEAYGETIQQYRYGAAEIIFEKPVEIANGSACDKGNLAVACLCPNSVGIAWVGSDDHLYYTEYSNGQKTIDGEVVTTRTTNQIMGVDSTITGDIVIGAVCDGNVMKFVKNGGAFLETSTGYTALTDGINRGFGVNAVTGLSSFLFQNGNSLVCLEETSLGVWSGSIVDNNVQVRAYPWLKYSWDGESIITWKGGKKGGASYKDWAGPLHGNIREFGQYEASYHSALAVDPSGYLYCLESSSVGTSLWKYGNGWAWVEVGPVVDSAITGDDVGYDLAAGPDGKLAAAVWDQNTIKLAVRDPLYGTWSLQSLPNRTAPPVTASVQNFPSIVYDDTGRLYVCLYDNHQDKILLLASKPNSTAPICGDSAYFYPTGDLNEDCYVDFHDFAHLAFHWLENSVPDGQGAGGQPVILTAPKTQACNIHNTQPDTSYNTWNLWIGWDGAGQIMDALLEFDMSAVPAEATIQDAKFYYSDYYNTNPPEVLPLYAEVYEATNAWNAVTETWNSYKSKGLPGYEPTILGIADFDTKNGYTMKYVSSAGLTWLVQNWLDNPNQNQGLYLKKDVQDIGYWCQMTSTWPAGTEPYMEIIYTIPVPACGDANHPYPIGDLDWNCVVDFSDLQLFVTHWLDCSDPNTTLCGPD
ncbi:MAG: DNRLRE domain-containing protein [Planctomycetota bacterium]